MSCRWDNDAVKINIPFCPDLSFLLIPRFKQGLMAADSCRLWEMFILAADYDAAGFCVHVLTPVQRNGYYFEKKLDGI